MGARKKAGVTEDEKFKRRADNLYFDGTPYLVKGFVALLAISVAYFASTMGTDFDIVDIGDTEKLKLILSSGQPWLVLCKTQSSKVEEALPVGFLRNVKGLGITKSALIDCEKPLPQSGASIIKKYNMDRKKKPIALLSVGGTHTQIDPKLLTSDDESLGQYVRKVVAKRYSITKVSSASALRAFCAKQRCVIWAQGATFFGPKTAVKYPKWHHVHIKNNYVQVAKRAVETAVLVWNSKPDDEKHALFLTEGSRFGDNVANALEVFEQDPSYAVEKSIRLDFEWANEKKIQSQPMEPKGREKRKSSESSAKHESTHASERTSLHDVDGSLEDTERVMTNTDGDDEGIDLDDS